MEKIWRGCTIFQFGSSFRSFHCFCTSFISKTLDHFFPKIRFNKNHMHDFLVTIQLPSIPIQSFLKRGNKLFHGFYDRPLFPLPDGDDEFPGLTLVFFLSDSFVVSFMLGSSTWKVPSCLIF